MCEMPLHSKLYRGIQNIFKSRGCEIRLSKLGQCEIRALSTGRWRSLVKERHSSRVRCYFLCTWFSWSACYGMFGKSSFRHIKIVGRHCSLGEGIQFIFRSADRDFGLSLDFFWSEKKHPFKGREFETSHLVLIPMYILNSRVSLTSYHPLNLIYLC